jgi:hypothetical protein
MGSGPAFSDESNPTVVVQVGAPGSKGTVEIGGIIFSIRGPGAQSFQSAVTYAKHDVAPGAIVVEWNVKQTHQGSAGMWDSYIRLGGAAGTNMQQSQCPTTSPSSSCYAAFLALHLTSGSNAYLEGTWVSAPSWIPTEQF